MVGNYNEPLRTFGEQLDGCNLRSGSILACHLPAFRDLTRGVRGKDGRDVGDVQMIKHHRVVRGLQEHHLGPTQQHAVVAKYCWCRISSRSKIGRYSRHEGFNRTRWGSLNELWAHWSMNCTFSWVLLGTTRGALRNISKLTKKYQCVPSP